MSLRLYFPQWLCSLYSCFTPCHWHLACHWQFCQKCVVLPQYKHILSLSRNGTFFYNNMYLSIILIASRDFLGGRGGGPYVLSIVRRVPPVDKHCSVHRHKQMLPRDEQICTSSAAWRRVMQPRLRFHFSGFTCPYGTRTCHCCCAVNSRLTLRKIITMTHTTSFVLSVVYVTTFYRLNGVEQNVIYNMQFI